MEQPSGFKEDRNYVCKLNKAIYGLKQAPRVRFDKLKTTLCDMGFESTKSDNSLFTKIYDAATIYILIYVDDLILTGNSDTKISKIIQYLVKQFSIKDHGYINTSWVLKLK